MRVATLHVTVTLFQPGLLGTRTDFGHQCIECFCGIKLRKQCAVGHQAAEQRPLCLLRASPDDDYRPAWNGRSPLVECLLQVLLVLLCGLVITVDLMLRPEIRS